MNEKINLDQTTTMIRFTHKQNISSSDPKLNWNLHFRVLFVSQFDQKI
jgi:hypothetical protein